MLSDAVLLSGTVLVGNILVSLLMDKRDKKHTDERIDSQKNLISKLFTWKDEHEKESANVRLGFSKEISELTAMVKVNQSQYAEILRRLDGLDNKIDRIETRNEG